MRKEDEPVVVEQTFNAPIDAVWSAITEIDQMVQWYFDNIPAFEPQIGFEAKFDVECGGRTFPHVWKVTEVVPGRKIAYDWSYEGYEGDSFVVFELFEEGSLTKLRLTHEVRETFPQDIPEFNRESCFEGWTYFITQSLKEYLENKTE